MSWLVLLVVAAAAARLTRLLNADDIARPARAWLTMDDEMYEAFAPWIDHARASGDDPWAHPTQNPPPFDQAAFAAARFVRCAWCVSVWVGLCLTLTYAAWPRATWWASLPLALSEAAALARARFEGD